MLRPPDAKNWLIWKDPDAGKDWGQEKKGTTEDEMAVWHHWLNGCESEWTPGVGDGQGGLACCGSWGRKESDTTEWLNWNELKMCSALIDQDVLSFKPCITSMPFYYCMLLNCGLSKKQIFLKTFKKNSVSSKKFQKFSIIYLSIYLSILKAERGKAIQLIFL